MCGLYGYSINGEDVSNPLVNLNTLIHRGPDQWAYWSNKELFMGHRRLSIIDLSEKAKQPMINKDENIIISVNGEIYNYLSIRKRLIDKYQFKSNSDSEVILHGYNEWGIDKLLNEIDGMFAIVIYDLKNKKLYLARDRVGIKPLYYSFINSQIVWGSELKAIVSHYNKSNFLELNNEAIFDFLTYLYIPTPKTMYKNVFKIEPGHYIDFDLSSKNINKKQYWNLEVIEKDIKINDAKEKLRFLINQSIKEHMISDVPVGFFLSGGLDSSIVTASASKFSNEIEAFSIGFDVAEHSELEYAELVASKLDINHKKKILSLDDTENSFNNLYKWYDEPFGDTSAFPTNLVAAFTKKSATVALTGDGGDEIFGGYKWYDFFSKSINYNFSNFNKIRPLIHSLSRKSSTFINKFLKRLDLLFMNDLEKYAFYMGNMRDDYKNVYKKEFEINDDYDDLWYFRKFYKPELPIFTRLQYLDFHTYLHDDILTKVDRATMAVSLEARVPLLSRSIIDFSFSLPQEVRLYQGSLKGLAKLSFFDTLPKEIIERDKKGFSIPTKVWRKNLYKDHIYPQETILKQFL